MFSRLNNFKDAWEIKKRIYLDSGSKVNLDMDELSQSMEKIINMITW